MDKSKIVKTSAPTYKVNAREVAVDTLMDIIKNKQYNNLTLKDSLSDERLTAGQKKVITELVNGVLRNKIYLEYCLDLVSNTKTDKMKPFIYCNLLVSVYEMLFMSEKNAFIINEAVNLTKKRGFSKLAPFVNGILRTVDREEKLGKFEIHKTKDLSQYISLKYSYPKWLAGYFVKGYGDTAEYICKFLNTTPKVSVAINNITTKKDDLIADLQSEDVEVTEFDTGLNLSNVGDLTRLKGYKEGHFWVMDTSSRNAMDLIDLSNINSKSVILDLCASPGGKSFYLASKLKGRVKVISCDLYEHKCNLLNEGYKRLKIKNFEVMQNDATVINDSFIDKADVCIVDAPCSGFGLLRKKPDIKYSKSYEDLKALEETAKDILSNAKLYVKENGQLVYSTCTLSRLENENVVEHFLEHNKNFELVCQKTFLPLSNEDSERLNIKDAYESDGFYVAVLRKLKTV